MKWKIPKGTYSEVVVINNNYCFNLNIIRVLLQAGEVKKKKKARSSVYQVYYFVPFVIFLHTFYRIEFTYPVGCKYYYSFFFFLSNCP